MLESRPTADNIKAYQVPYTRLGLKTYGIKRLSQCRMGDDTGDLLGPGGGRIGLKNRGLGPKPHCSREAWYGVGTMVGTSGIRIPIPPRTIPPYFLPCLLFFSHPPSCYAITQKKKVGISNAVYTV
jgi:hypothetical protein